MEAPLADRQRETDGVTNGNPSHPIPSQTGVKSKRLATEEDPESLQ
jgi:hypothetical protein